MTDVSLNAYLLNKQYLPPYVTYADFLESHWPNLEEHYAAQTEALLKDPYPGAKSQEEKLKQLYMTHASNAISSVAAALVNLESEERNRKMHKVETFIRGHVGSACDRVTYGIEPLEVLAAAKVDSPLRFQTDAKQQIEAGFQDNWHLFHIRSGREFDVEKFKSHFFKLFSKQLPPGVNAPATDSTKQRSKMPGLVDAKSGNTAMPALVDVKSVPNLVDYERLMGVEQAKQANPNLVTFSQLFGEIDIERTPAEWLHEKKEKLAKKWRAHKEKRDAERDAERAKKEAEAAKTMPPAPQPGAAPAPEPEIAGSVGHRYHHSSSSSSGSYSSGDESSSSGSYHAHRGSHRTGRLSRSASRSPSPEPYARSPSPALEASSGDMESPDYSRSPSPDYETPISNTAFQFSFVGGSASKNAPATGVSEPVSKATSAPPGLVKLDKLTAAPVPTRGLVPASEKSAVVQKLLAKPTIAQGYLKSFLQLHGQNFENQALVFLAPSNDRLQASYAELKNSKTAQANLVAAHLFVDANPGKPLRSVDLEPVVESGAPIRINRNGEIATSTSITKATPMQDDYCDKRFGLNVRILSHNSILPLNRGN